jgi:hypothetical protein
MILRTNLPPKIRSLTGERKAQRVNKMIKMRKRRSRNLSKMMKKKKMIKETPPFNHKMIRISMMKRENRTLRKGQSIKDDMSLTKRRVVARSHRMSSISRCISPSKRHSRG